MASCTAATDEQSAPDKTSTTSAVMSSSTLLVPGSNPATSPSPSTTAPIALHQVAEIEVELVDENRPTIETANVTDGSNDRRIKTVIYYPTDHPGPFPLVIYNHGLNWLAELSADHLAEVAQFGYVVAGIDPPETSGGIGFEGVRHHTFHARDISFTIDQIIEETVGLPPGIIDGERIAVTGSSLGGAAVFALAFNSCCRDERISAVISYSGAVLDQPDGTFTWTGPPILMVYTDTDFLVPLAVATGVMEDLTTPGFLMTLHGGDQPMHGALGQDDIGHDEVIAAVREFLATYLDDSELEAKYLVDGWTGEHTDMITSPPG